MHKLVVKYGTMLYNITKLLKQMKYSIIPGTEKQISNHCFRQAAISSRYIDTVRMYLVDVYIERQTKFLHIPSSQTNFTEPTGRSLPEAIWPYAYIRKVDVDQSELIYSTLGRYKQLAEDPQDNYQPSNNQYEGIGKTSLLIFLSK